MKHYRVKLFPGANSAADKAVLAAATANAMNEPFSLENIATIGKAENCPDTTIELFSENRLIIDHKPEGAEHYQQGAIIEEVDIVPLKETVNDLQDCFN